MEKITYEDEIWKPVVGWEGFYEVSNKGRVRSLTRTIHADVPKKDGTLWHQEYIKQGRILKLHDNGHSYLNVGLHAQGRKDKHSYIHIMVAQAFIPNPNNYPQVNHKDFDKSNNTVENLEWVSDLDNKLHYRKSKRAKNIEKKRIENIQFKCYEKIIKNKKQIINLYEEGYSIKEIAKELSLGRDFVSIVLKIFDIT